MRYDKFVGNVQHRAQLSDGGQAMRAIHATLGTLSERLFGGEAEQLSAQLPSEIGYYLQESNLKEKFDLEEFYERVGVREEVRFAEAARHARAVISVLCDAVSPGEIADVRAQLPREFDDLFENPSHFMAAPEIAVPSPKIEAKKTMLPLRKILCPIDWSEPSYAALDRAGELAARFGAELCVLHVVPFSPPFPADLMVIVPHAVETDRERMEAAARQLDEVMARHPQLHVKMRPIVKMGYTANEIACLAREENADLIMLATHGRSGLTHLMLGSVAEKVLHLSPCPVLTVRPDESGEMPALLPLETILCPIDYSEASLAALDAASELAEYSGAGLNVLHVVAAPTSELGTDAYVSPEERAADRKRLSDLIAERVPAAVTAHPVLRSGDPAHEIEHAARKEKAGLVVIATHGTTGWRHMVFGSVAEAIVRQAHCPVLTVHATPAVDEVVVDELIAVEQEVGLAGSGVIQ